MFFFFTGVFLAICANASVAIFSVARNTARLRDWRYVIPSKDRLLTRNNVTCMKNNRKSAPYQSPDTQMQWRFPGVYTMRIAALSNDAVHTIYPNCPKRLLKYTKQRNTLWTEMPWFTLQKKWSWIQRWSISLYRTRAHVGVPTGNNYIDIDIAADERKR